MENNLLILILEDCETAAANLMEFELREADIPFV
jgi:hypothetical protein